MTWLKTLLFFLIVAVLCAACSSESVPNDSNVQKASPPANVAPREPRVGMGINEFHEVCGPSTGGMATEGAVIVMPYKPKAGRKPECVGLF